MACIYSEHDTLPVATIRVVGRVTEHDMDVVLPKMEAFIERHGTVRILEVIERFEGFDPTTILDGMKFDLKHLRDVSHAAVVTDIGWLGIMTQAASMAMPLTIRTFPTSQLEQAIAWIEQPEGQDQAA